MSAAVAVRRFDRRRWWWCFVAIAAVHAGGVWLVVHWPVAETSASPPVVMTIDLTPLAAARPPSTARERPKPVARARPPEPLRQPVVPRAPASRVDVPLPRQLPRPMPGSHALPEPPVAAPLPPVPQSQVAAPPQVVAPPAPAAVATAPSVAAAAPPSNAAPTWQGLLLGRLEKFKRYPSSAQLRRQQGVAYLRFAMDRRGHVVSAVIDRSSGFDALDAEALALVHRAEPLPPPPPEVPGDPIELVVPVEFFLKPAS